MITTFTYHKQLSKSIECSEDFSFSIWDTNLTTINLFKKDEFVKLFQDKPDLKIEKGAKLYFTKQSKFAREKLANSEYKKCIKIEKADYIVIPNSIDQLLVSLFIMKLNGENYAFDYLNIRREGHYYNLHELTAKFPQIKDAKKDYIGGNVIRLLNENLEEKIKYGVENNIPIITDKDLDKVFQAKLPQLTPDDLVNIYDMLSSTDSSTVQLGIKLLSSYNLIGYENAISFLFYSLPGNAYNWVNTLTAFKSIEEAIHYAGKFYNTISKYKFSECSEDEKQLIKPIAKKLLIELAENEIQSIKENPITAAYNLKLSFTINE